MVASSPAPESLVITSGTCYALFAYEIGLSIDLDRCETRISTLTKRERLSQKRRAPRYFDYRPAPLRVTEDGESQGVGAYRTTESVDLVLFDFGAVSVTYSIPLSGRFADLVELSEVLFENEILLADSRQRVTRLLNVIGSAVARPQLADFVESYSIFDITAFSEALPPQSLYTTLAHPVAQILRSERMPLSSLEIEDATTHRIAYGADDVAIIDWDATLLYGRDTDDVRAVLEFANAELLEMRYLDQQLDDALDESYVALSRQTWRWLRLSGASHSDLRRVAQLQVDSAILFEGVNNALKLVGDQYLARVYRLASGRFHLVEWDASILRKLQTLESIYQKMADAAANRRLEWLEWIIIILTAVSIIVYVIPGLSPH